MAASATRHALRADRVVEAALARSMSPEATQDRQRGGGGRVPARVQDGLGASDLGSKKGPGCSESPAAGCTGIQCVGVSGP
eukprot:7160506-Pyramimonas_sp.AAC.1